MRRGRKKGAFTPRSLLKRAWYECFRYGLFGVLTAGWRYRAFGVTNVPDTGPVLLLPNHLSHIDPALVALPLRRQVYGLARTTHWTEYRLVGWLMKSLNAIPLNRDAGGEGLVNGRALLEAGEVLNVFPEGTRSVTGQLGTLKAGFHTFCDIPGLQIVPVGIAGADVMWPKGRWPRQWAPIIPYPQPRPSAAIVVCFGPPIPASSLQKRDVALSVMNDAIWEQVLRARAHQR